MRIHRFYIENIDINKENTVVTQETSLIHQLKNVFRYKSGQKIHIFNEKIGELEVELININKKDMSFKYIRHIKDLMDNKIDNEIIDKKIYLYMSVIKNSNFDLIIEKAVELGVYEIIPVISERSIKNQLNIIRINKIIKEATEQSGRLDLMKIGNIVDLKNAINTAKDNSDIVYFGSVNENDDSKNINNVYDKSSISLFIGPEGGFSEDEISMFFELDLIPLRLGKYILRAETAAIVGCGIMFV